MLIRTKLIPPSLPADHVPRPRLWAELGPDPERCVTLVVAPAGFGKTTLVSSWLAASGLARACWVTLDSLDSRPRQFSQYLLAGLKAALPDAFHGSDRALTEPGLSWTVIEQTLCSDLAAVDEPLALVLDDYHVLDRDAPHGLVERFVESCSADVHVVIVGREQPPLPISRWRARGRLREIGLRDLAFNAEEARLFMDSARPRDRGGSMGGWPAGLRLAKLSGLPLDSPLQDPGMPTGVEELIRDEVLGRLPPEVLGVLSVALPFPRFCEGLLAHVLEAAGRTDLDAREAIRVLERHQLFITHLEDGGSWYGFHDVFREGARRFMLERVGVDAVREVVLQGARWFQREGHLEEAIRLLVGIGALDPAADVVGQGLERTLLQDPSRRQLLRWLDLFPEGAEEGRLPLLAADAAVAARRYDAGRIGTLLGRIDDLGAEASTRADPLLRSLIGSFRSIRHFLTGDPEAALTEAVATLASDGAHVGGWAWTAAVIYRSLSLAALGRRSEALRVLAEAEDDHAGQEGAGHWALTQGALINTRISIGIYSGDLEQAKAQALRMLSMPPAVSIPDYWLGCARYALGLVALDLDDLEGGDAHFASVIPFRHTMPTRAYHEALVGRSLVALALGDVDGAMAWADEAFTYAREVNDAGSQAASISLRRRIQGPKMVLAGPMPPPDRGLAGWWLEVPVLTYARALVTAPEAAAVDPGEYVAAAYRAAERVHSRRVSMALALLLAATLDGQGRVEEGEALLRATLEGAEHTHLRRAILDSGPAVHALMERCGFPVPAVRYPLSGGRTDRGRRANTRAGPSDLTPRQQEILGCLFRRLSNAEIAEELFISPETVKTHVAALCRKLGARNRREAVEIARGRPSTA